MASPSLTANSKLHELTNSDIALLVNILNPVAWKCYAIGLQLGVNVSQIKNIMRNYSLCEEQLCEIITQRLKQQSPLTWNDIITTLTAPSVNEKELACEIEDRYVHPLTPLPSVAPQPNTISPALLTSAPQPSLSASHYDNSQLVTQLSAANTDTVLCIPVSKLSLHCPQHIHLGSPKCPLPSTSVSSISTGLNNPNYDSITQNNNPLSAVVVGSSANLSSMRRLPLKGNEVDSEQVKVRERGKREEKSSAVRQKRKKSRGCTFSKLISESEGMTEERTDHEHGNESSSSSSSLSSSSEYEESRRPVRSYVAQKEMRKSKLATTFTYKKRKPDLKERDIKKKVDIHSSIIMTET